MLENPPKGPPFQFFRHCETFFSEFFFLKGIFSIQLFCCFASEWMLENPKGSPISIFRHCEIFFRKKNFPPFNFLMYCDRMDVEKPQRAPLSVFRHCETFFQKFVFSPKGPPFKCDKNVDNFGSVPLLARQRLALAGPGAPLGPFFCFSIFEYCKLTLGSLFAIFVPWIWRRLGPVLACLKLF